MSSGGPNTGPRLDLRQTQGLVMTPQLQQAIKLLQMSNLELSEHLMEELEKNPLLERAEGNNAQDQEDADATSREKEFIKSESDLEALQNLPQARQETDPDVTKVEAAPMDDNFDHIWSGGDAYAGTGKGGSSNFDDNDFSYEKTLTKEKSLRDHLEEQIMLSFDKDREKALAFALMDRISAAGYLRETADELALSLGIEKTDVETVLMRLKGFDPTGIFAYDLKECLALQLKEKNRYDPAMQAFVENIELMGQHDHKKILDVCGVEIEDLRDMILEIRQCNPKPAGLFDHVIVQTAIPDVFVFPKKTETGMGWHIELNKDTLPRVLVNKRYYTEIKDMAHNKEEKNFVEEQMQNANWMVRAMDQRAQTILKVTAEIVKQQDAFFAYGLQYLKPMTLRDIADKIEMHESTVSRVTSSKYIGTPRGLFDMKFFFSSGLGSTDGGMEHSSESVRARIKTMIEEEDKILSDEKLAALLKAEGVDIARRTVAKYREAMNIPTSSIRKRQRKSLL